MNAVVAIVRANLIRLVAERSNLFFLVVLPLLIVFSLGIAIGGGGGEVRVGVVDRDPTHTSSAVLDTMSSVGDVQIVSVDSASALRDAVARRALDVGYVVDAGDDDASITFRWYAPATGDGNELRSVLAAAAEEADLTRRAVAVVARDAGVDVGAAEAAVERAAATGQQVEVAVRAAGEGTTAASIRGVLAAGQLTLFIFLSSLTGAVYLLLTRNLGVTRRMRAGPVTVGAIVLGEGLSRFLVAMLQAAVVFFGSWLLFGVDWRAPGAVLLLCLAMSLVGTGAAMLLGTLGRSEQQVSAVGLMAGLVLGALGGSMQPLEFFPDALRTVAFATPHAWMNDALWRILVDGAGLGQVWPALAVLTAAGVALLVLASAALARSLR